MAMKIPYMIFFFQVVQEMEVNFFLSFTFVQLEENISHMILSLWSPFAIGDEHFSNEFFRLLPLCIIGGKNISLIFHSSSCSSHSNPASTTTTRIFIIHGDQALNETLKYDETLAKTAVWGSQVLHITTHHVWWSLCYNRSNPTAVPFTPEQAVRPMIVQTRKHEAMKKNLCLH